MKRKILFALMIMAFLTCVLAISVSAATVLIDEIYYDLNDSTMQATVSSSNQKNCKKSVVVIPSKVTYNNAEYNVTAIAAKAFGSQNSGGGNSNITSVTVPSSVASVGERAFANCPNLTSAYCYSTAVGDRMFQDSPVTTLVLENTVQIGQYAFTRVGVTSVIFPSTLTTIGDYAFKECKNLTKVVFLGSTIGAYMFNSCSALNTLVVTENYTTFGAASLGSANSKPFVTYYTGSDYQRVITLGSSTSRFSEAGVAEYTAYDNSLYTAKTYMVTYNANLCEVAFNGVHLEDGNPCVINCTRCGASGVAEENPVHTDSVSIVYANGYHMEGAKITGCANEGCKHSTSVSFPAIFNCLGYSAKESGTGIATGFSVNYDVLDEYKEIEGGNIKFGMVVFNPSYIGDTFFDENGKINATSGAIQVEFNQNYASFNASVAGFDLSNVAHQNLELVFAGYSYTKADKSDIKLFQKEYTVGTPELPNYSPMQSKVTKGDAVAYTVKIQTVTTPTLVTTGKDGLEEF
ncbi:MAG: leucine-rich repeat domain-containing protein [Ruminococcaceae bacterium]|nr:leucine-rich repeat domain-containing protein [Oscillospiraceae bacterium]